MMWYPTVNDNADLEFLLTPQCKVRNFSFASAMRSKYNRYLTGLYNLPQGWKFYFQPIFMPEYCFLRRYPGIFSLPQNLVRVFERF